MTNRTYITAADSLVSKANTEQELVNLIDYHKSRTNYNGRNTEVTIREQHVAREVVKRAYRKLSRYG